MLRKLLVASVGLCILVAPACAGSDDGAAAPKLDEFRKGVYVITETPRDVGTLIARRSEKVDSTAVNTVLLTMNCRLFVRAMVASNPHPKPIARVDTALAALKARNNNIYALAVNTGGIARANEAVKQGGRVFLRAAGSYIPSVRLAKAD